MKWIEEISLKMDLSRAPKSKLDALAEEVGRDKVAAYIAMTIARQMHNRELLTINREDFDRTNGAN